MFTSYILNLKSSLVAQNLGYENQKIAVESTLAAEDDPAQVLGRLRAFVADQDPALVQAQAVVAAPDQYAAGAVQKARQRLGLPPEPAPPPPPPAPPDAPGPRTTIWKIYALGAPRPALGAARSPVQSAGAGPQGARPGRWRASGAPPRPAAP